MKKVLSKMFRVVCGILFLPFWWLERLIPRDKRIFVFGSRWGRKYSDNPKALYEFILKNETNLKPYWITKDKKLYKKLLSENKPVVMTYSLKEWWISLHASAAFTCTDQSNINRYALNGAKHVFLFHGMPLKQIRGNKEDSIYNINEKRLSIKSIQLIIIKYLIPYDYFKSIVCATISSGDFFMPFLEQAFFLSIEKVWTTGLPRTDYYFDNKTDGTIDNIRKKYTDSRIVLYMPTIRDTRWSKGISYNPFEEKSFDSQAFSEFLNNENIVFLYKAHINDISVNFSFLSDRFILIKEDDYEELYVLISNIDILITDYSSVYFDFLCLNKPAILAPFDYEDYVRTSRKMNFDYELLTSIKAYNWNELMYIITEKKYYVVPKEEADKFCKYNDGHACERVLQKTLNLIN